MAFVDELLPEAISYGARGGPRFQTVIQTLDAGAESRISRHSTPRWSWNVGYAIRSRAEIAELQKFYISVARGRARSFRFKDHLFFTTHSDGVSDPTATDELLINTATNEIGGDGVTTTFRCVKRVNVGDQTTIIPILLPVESSVLIAIDGVAQGSGWSVNGSLSGIVTFDTPPALGEEPSWGGQFHNHVRFDFDAEEILNLSLESYEQISAPDLPLISVIDDGELPDEFFYGGAKVHDPLAASVTLSVAQGRTHTFYNVSAGKDVNLPDPATLPGGGPYFYLVHEGASNNISVKSGGVEIFVLAPADIAECVIGLDSGGNPAWFII